MDADQMLKIIERIDRAEEKIMRKVDAYDERLVAVENTHRSLAWRVSAVCGGFAFVAQVAITAAIEYFKK